MGARRSAGVAAVSVSLLAAACSGVLPEDPERSADVGSFGMIRAVPSTVPMAAIPEEPSPPTAYRFVIPTTATTTTTTTTTAPPTTTTRPSPKPVKPKPVVTQPPVTIPPPPPTAPDQWLTDGLAAIRRCTRSTWASPGGAFLLSPPVWETYGDGSPTPETASLAAQTSAARKAAMASAAQLGDPWAIWTHCKI